MLTEIPQWETMMRNVGVICKLNPEVTDEFIFIARTQITLAYKAGVADAEKCVPEEKDCLAFRHPKPMLGMQIFVDGFNSCRISALERISRLK